MVRTNASSSLLNLQDVLAYRISKTDSYNVSFELERDFNFFLAQVPRVLSNTGIMSQDGAIQSKRSDTDAPGRDPLQFAVDFWASEVGSYLSEHLVIP